MNIQINTKKLKDLKPCADRFKNWLEHYGDFEGSFCEFLDLGKITYADKIFVIKKLVPIEILERWAILCVESVLYIFEEKYPDDKRPRECLGYLKTGEKNQEKLDYHRRAAAEAYATYAAAAAYVADAAAYAVYAAVYAAAAAVYVADAAAYAAAAAYVAADAAYATDDASGMSEQRKKNLEFLKSLLTVEV